MPERTYLLTVGIIALIFILHSIDDNSFCLDTDRRCSAASRSMERDSAGIEPGQCDGREPPIGLGAEERMVDTKAMEVVVEEGDRLV
jgi:hypothetical protein